MRTGDEREGIVTPLRACGPAGGSVAKRMKKISYRGYRFPPEIIQQAIWLYVRFTLSLRDVEGLLAERGIMVSYCDLLAKPVQKDERKLVGSAGSDYLFLSRGAGFIRGMLV